MDTAYLIAINRARSYYSLTDEETGELLWKAYGKRFNLKHDKKEDIVRVKGMTPSIVKSFVFDRIFQKRR